MQVQDDPFAVLEGHKYINLTTYHRIGTPVVPPVWFARHGHHLYVMTVLNVGKVKRIRNNPKVSVAPSDRRGTALGGDVPATARLLPLTEAQPANEHHGRKYGLMKQIFDALLRMRGIERAFIEIELGSDVNNRPATT